MTISKLKTAVLGTSLCLIQACTIAPFQTEIDSPEPSKAAFVSEDSDTATALSYSHQLPAQKVHAKGAILNYIYQQNKQPIDTPEFFKAALTNELTARALPVELADQGAGQLALLQYDTIVHRNNGFSPLVMIALAKLDLTANDKRYRIGAMIKRAKVPIWTLTEEPLVEATINQPQELLVKEVAAKINLALFNNKLPDAQVAALVQSIKTNLNTDEDSAYQDVYELGYSNNPAALPALREFSQHSAEYIRLAAISGMGMIGKNAVLEELKSLYASGRQWQDRAVALKAIGDIQSEESTAFLMQEREKWKGQHSLEASWNKQILAIYLD